MRTLPRVRKVSCGYALGCTAPLIIAAVSACASAPPHGGSPSETEWEHVLEAEDARAVTHAHERTLRTALSSSHAALRALAVRALGRTERGAFRDDIAAMLRDPDPAVRVAAAHALGHVTRDSSSAAVRGLLLGARPAPAADPDLAGAIGETLGRLRQGRAAAEETADRLVSLLAHEGAARAGALRGLYFLARQPDARGAVASRAQEITAGMRDERSAHLRALTVATIAAAGAATPGMLRAAAADGDRAVRREGVAAAGALADSTVPAIIAAALDDADPQVRYEALRAYGRRLAATQGCGPVADAARDPDTHVSLLALSLTASEPCRASAPHALLDSIARGLREDAWHRAAGATVSLATLGHESAAGHVTMLARSTSPFARAYAARAAGSRRDAAVLRRLASDPHAIVRTAAVNALHETEGHAADSVYVAQLGTEDSELLQAAVRALDGSTSAGLAERMLDALDRITQQQSETSRDARVALLNGLRERAALAHADRLRPYLRDFDPVVAARAADVLRALTGESVQAEPRPLPRLALPSHADLQQLERSRFVLEMQDGGEIEIALMPFVAPTNAWRFARLARSGYYDGLTIHRVVPNFVVQGGSPGANEYSGDAAFTRDELGASNVRGTVGLSTRGRDTGDAQFYINLIDNVRLDHEYTIFGTVTRGMERVDALLEGAVIRRVREIR
jgi:cyclophilin family peptidyl-prolyl cis-trans isomerase/HEAT repeat protein